MLQQGHRARTLAVDGRARNIGGERDQGEQCEESREKSHQYPRPRVRAYDRNDQGCEERQPGDPEQPVIRRFAGRVPEPDGSCNT